MEFSHFKIKQPYPTSHTADFTKGHNFGAIEHIWPKNQCSQQITTKHTVHCTFCTLFFIYKKPLYEEPGLRRLKLQGTRGLK